MEAQPYSIHKAPAIMGMTQWHWQDFLDSLTIANDMQLEQMKKALVQEIESRDRL